MTSSKSSGCFDEPQVIASRAVFDNHAVGAVPKDRFAKERWAMACIHATIFNAIEAVYKNATHIAPNDVQTYLDFAREMVWTLELHHENEETIYFPVFERHAISMEGYKEQHHAFLGGVRATLAYLDTVDPRKANTAAFSATKLRQLIDGFVPLAAQHMADELSSLDPDLLRKQGLTIAELDGAEKGMADHTKAVFNPLTFLPGLVYSRPHGCLFPDAPWFVTGVIAPLFTLANRRRWKYYWSERLWEKTPPNPPT